jgi:hypothetical protein
VRNVKKAARSDVGLGIRQKLLEFIGTLGKRQIIVGFPNTEGD